MTRGAELDVGETWCGSSRTDLFLKRGAGSRQSLVLCKAASLSLGFRQNAAATELRRHRWLQISTHLTSFPFSSVLRREGAARLELIECDGLDLESSLAIGVDGKGFTVAVDRPLSVEVLVIELKREPASFLVIVTAGQWQREEPCQFQ